MSAKKIDATAVRDILTAVAAEDPDRIDRRAATDRLAPRYAEHGCPACLVGEIMFRLGVKINVLKEMHETPLLELKMPIQKRFTPLAWEMLAAIQWCNDRGYTWARAQSDVLGVTRGWFPWWLQARAWMEEIDG